MKLYSMPNYTESFEPVLFSIKLPLIEQIVRYIDFSKGKFSVLYTKINSIFDVKDV